MMFIHFVHMWARHSTLPNLTSFPVSLPYKGPETAKLESLANGDINDPPMKSSRFNDRKFPTAMAEQTVLF